MCPTTHTHSLANSPLVGGGGGGGEEKEEVGGRAGQPQWWRYIVESKQSHIIVVTLGMFKNEIISVYSKGKIREDFTE